MKRQKTVILTRGSETVRNPVADFPVCSISLPMTPYARAYGKQRGGDCYRLLHAAKTPSVNIGYDGSTPADGDQNTCGPSDRRLQPAPARDGRPLPRRLRGRGDTMKQGTLPFLADPGRRALRDDCEAAGYSANDAGRLAGRIIDGWLLPGLATAPASEQLPASVIREGARR
jgi:hypothetical protein